MDDAIPRTRTTPAVPTSSVAVDRRGAIMLVRLHRPAKRNAIDGPMLAALEAVFARLPDDVRAVVLHGAGPHFCAGLDLTTLAAGDAVAIARTSRAWHRALSTIADCGVPVLAVLHGAVVGGGLELAAAAHLRVAESGAWYALPEAAHGIYVGGGASVRLPRLIGTARVLDMMLTGRTHQAEEGLGLGFSQYTARDGTGLSTALALAEQIAAHAPTANWGVLTALPRAAGGDAESGLLIESLMAGVVGSATTALQGSRWGGPCPPERGDAAGRSAPVRTAPAWSGTLDAGVDERGCTRLRWRDDLPPSSTRRVTAWLEHWAEVAPERTLLAERDGPERDGPGWRRVSWAQARTAVQSLGQALLDRHLVGERVLILSGNSVEHGLLTMAALHVGAIAVPVSPAYSLLSSDFARLRAIVATTEPRLVLVDDAERFRRAVAACVPAGVEVVARSGATDGVTTPFDALLATTPGPSVAAAAAAVTPDTVGKLLFTSGSTGAPKGVVMTHGMLLEYAEVFRAAYPVLAEEPPVLVDWLPWNHVQGGNCNVGMVLRNGGTLMIDGGSPRPAELDETVRNLREVAPTVHFGVPRAFEVLLPRLQADEALRATFFSRLRVLQYAGAVLSRAVRDGFDRLAVETVGARIPWSTALGSTEAGPITVHWHRDDEPVACVGLPAPGVEVVLVPVDGRTEGRVRSRSVTPGYWGRPELTRESRDDRGLLRTGDALEPADPLVLERGLVYAGRVADDFKLTSGTWVRVAALRARVLAALGPAVRDVVLVGENRGYVAALAIPDEPGGPAASVRAAVERRLRRAADAATGESQRVVRFAFLTEPLTVDSGDLTDKGAVSQRNVARNHRDAVEALYAEPPSDAVIVVSEDHMIVS